MKALAALLIMVTAPVGAQEVNRYTGKVDPATGLTGPYDPQNPFARILRGELPRELLYENDLVMVIMPLTMIRPGHVLVIPKRQGARTLLELTPQEMQAVLVTAQKAARAQVKALGATGFSIQQNNGIDSFQHVFHPHFHVIPTAGPNQPARRDEDRNTRDELAAMAEKLRAAWPED